MIKLGNKRITLPVVIFLAVIVAAAAVSAAIALRYGKGEEILTENLNPKLGFTEIPAEYAFTYDGGETTITLNPDGTFEGLCRTGEENSSAFNGRFGRPEMINEYTFLAEIDGLESPDGSGEITAHGFEGADEMLIFMPGTPLALIHSECVPQLNLEEGADSLPDNMYVLYNFIGDYPFIGYSHPGD